MSKRVTSTKTPAVIFASIALALCSILFAIIFTYNFQLYTDRLLEYSDLMRNTLQNAVGFIAPTLLFVGVLNYKKAIFEKMLLFSVVGGIAVSLFSTLLLPVINGSAFGNDYTRLIRTAFYLIPAAFLIIDFFCGHKMAIGSVIVCAFMIAVQLLSGIVNLINLGAVNYGAGSEWAFSCIISAVSALRSVAYWATLLICHIRYIKIGKAESTAKQKTQAPQQSTSPQFPASLQDATLEDLNGWLDKGAISEEEYWKIKDILFQRTK